MLFIECLFKFILLPSHNWLLVVLESFQGMEKFRAGLPWPATPWYSLVLSLSNTDRGWLCLASEEIRLVWAIQGLDKMPKKVYSYILLGPFRKESWFPWTSFVVIKYLLRTLNIGNCLFPPKCPLCVYCSILLEYLGLIYFSIYVLLKTDSFHIFISPPPFAKLGSCVTLKTKK